MIFDLFNELQMPEPWAPEHEREVFANALTQVRLADELGYGCWWSVEHHCAPEFSYSSAPELMNAAIAQHTERIRIGHAGVLTPFRINHPLRVAERAAVLDHLSHGRVELGLARSGGAEWSTFGIDPDATLAELEETARLCVAAWTEPEFSWESERLSIPKRTVVPKPVQQPHPAIWQTVSSPSSFRMAGELGMGILCTTLLSPVSVLESMVVEYEAGLAACVNPVGKFVNDQRGVFTFVFCTETVDDAIKSRAAEAALWYVNAAPKVFSVPRTVWTNLIRGNVNMGAPKRAQGAVDESRVQVDLDPEDENPIVRLMNRQVLGYDIDPVEAYEALEHQDSVIIGDVDTCLRKAKKYQAAGFGRLMGLMQFGHLRHDEVMASIRRVGEALIPELSAGGGPV
jgi:alkanesulfonate monooxygenase SsuD/methylene tetrahydromethanopterin reductase-like flavin-dependent oxidoreductase (luciferase family)